MIRNNFLLFFDTCFTLSESLVNRAKCVQCFGLGHNDAATGRSCLAEYRANRPRQQAQSLSKTKPPDLSRVGLCVGCFSLAQQSNRTAAVFRAGQPETNKTKAGGLMTGAHIAAKSLVRRGMQKCSILHRRRQDCLGRLLPVWILAPGFLKHPQHLPGVFSADYLLTPRRGWE